MPGISIARHLPSQANKFGVGNFFENAFSTLFDNSNDYVSIGDIVQAVGSLTFWFKAEFDGYIFSKVKSGGAFDGEFRVQMTGDKIKFRIQDAGVGDFDIFSNATLKDNTWRHCFLTWPDMKMYINGVLQTDTETATKGMEVTGVDLEFGRNNALANGHYGGNLDEMYMLNIQGNQAQVDEWYNGGKPKDPFLLSTTPNIVHGWRFGDEDTFPTIIDIFGSADGTMNGMTAGSFVNDVI